MKFETIASLSVLDGDVAIIDTDVPSEYETSLTNSIERTYGWLGYSEFLNKIDDLFVF